MRRVRTLLAFFLVVALAFPAALDASALPVGSAAASNGAPIVHRAQAGAGGAIDPQRHCNTVVKCQFARGGTYRGCISAYTCRACKFVESRCTITGREQVCRKLRCDWGA